MASLTNAARLRFAAQFKPSIALPKRSGKACSLLLAASPPVDDGAWLDLLSFQSSVPLSKLQRSRVVLVLLLAVAFIPAGALVYLQYRSLSQVQQHMHQALFANLQQAVSGACVEAENDISSWYRRAVLGPEVHEWLRRRNIRRMQNVAETTRRICPYVSIFFGYRLRPGAQPEIFIFRPGGEEWSMDLSRSDRAEPQLRHFVESLNETSAHGYRELIDLDGERQQLFLHLVDDDVLEPKEPHHLGEIGYYGIAIPGRVLTQQYFPKLLQKHLSRLATTYGQIPGDRAVGAIFDEKGVQQSVSEEGVTSSFPVQENLIQETGVLPGWTMRAGFPTGALAASDNSDFARNIGIVLVIAAVLLAAILSLGVTTAREIQFSRTKTEFVASVSHELKTPLSLIRGFVETLHLNRLAAPSQREEYFGIIEAEIQRLSDMIDTILDISKIEVGLKRYRPENVDVGDLIEETLAHFSPEFERRSFAVNRQIEASLPPAHVDPHAFSQALVNLLSNAVKYSGVDRTILVKAVRNNGNLEVSVSDQGLGVPKWEQERIFDSFCRASNTAAHAPGAGLGLALVKHFARAHGGAVTVTSAPGRGSCFAILLPLPQLPLPQ
jgi:signal transduction histidine kinase